MGGDPDTESKKQPFSLELLENGLFQDVRASLLGIFIRVYCVFLSM